MKEMLFLLIIIQTYFYICVSEGCSDFQKSKQYYCLNLKSEDPNKKCSFINDRCISNYKTCED